MPRSETIKVSRGGDERVYTVWYSDDSPEREEAVTFFQTKATCLFPKMDIPAIVGKMSIHEANEFLQAHPIQQQWSLLRINRSNAIADDDLKRLVHLPELETVCISANITDEGVRHLLLVPALEALVVYSPRVTNECLKYLRRMKSLRMVDFQASPGVSRSAFNDVVRSMTPIPQSWPPFAGIAEHGVAPNCRGIN